MRRSVEPVEPVEGEIMRSSYHTLSVLGVVSLLTPTSSRAVGTPQNFNNPIGRSQNADPTIKFVNNNFYALRTAYYNVQPNNSVDGQNAGANACDILMYKAQRAESVYMAPAQTKRVFTCNGTEVAGDVWAPALANINNIWFIVASGKYNDARAHHNFLLQGCTDPDPANCTYTYKGSFTGGDTQMTLDGEIMVYGPTPYLVYSRWRDASGAPNWNRQEIALAQITGGLVSAGAPTTGPATVIARPDTTSCPDPSHGNCWDAENQNGGGARIHEGPQGVFYGNTLAVVFSTGACWTNQYALAMVTYLKTDLTPSSVLNPANWGNKRKKFGYYADGNQVSTGHHSMFTDASGAWWFAYHAIESGAYINNWTSHDDNQNLRKAYLHKVDSWTGDDPNFGYPVPNGFYGLGPTPGY